MYNNNPFAQAPPPHWGGVYTEIIGAPARIAAVRRFNREELLLALNVFPLQKTVRDAIERRLRRIARERL